MKKYSIAVCVCAVLFSVGIHGGGMREVFARAPGADENLAILQDIIRENECQAGMAFLGYTYEGAEAAEILEYTRQGEVAAAYPFLQDGTVVDAGGYEIYAIVPEHDSALNIKIAREQLSETDEVSYYLGLGMSLWYTGTDEYIEGRNCPVFVLGTDHEDHFTKEHYYAVGDNVVYYYDPSGDAWLLLGAG